MRNKALMGIFAVLFSLATIVGAFAADVNSFVMVNSSDASTISVGASATVYTKSIDISNCESFSVSYLANSAASTPNLKIQIEQSWTKPATEGSSDSNWTIPGSVADIETSLTAETLQQKAITPIVTKYLRLKITEMSGTVADTTLQIKINAQSKI